MSLIFFDLGGDRWRTTTGLNRALVRIPPECWCSTNRSRVLGQNKDQDARQFLLLLQSPRTSKNVASQVINFLCLHNLAHICGYESPILLGWLGSLDIAHIVQFISSFDSVININVKTFYLLVFNSGVLEFGHISTLSYQQILHISYSVRHTHCNYVIPIWSDFYLQQTCLRR